MQGAGAAELRPLREHRHPGDDPVAGAGAGQFDVGDFDGLAVQLREFGVVGVDFGADQIAQDGRFAGAGLEGAQRHRAGRERDVAGFDGGDAQHGDEDAAAVAQLHDQPERPGRGRQGADGDDDVADAADDFEVRAADLQPRQAPGVGAGGVTHGFSLNPCAGQPVFRYYC